MKPDFFRPNSEAFHRWENNTDEDDAKEYWLFYLFNVTNPDEVLLGMPAKLQEIGPYSYIQYEINFECFWFGFFFGLVIGIYV